MLSVDKYFLGHRKKCVTFAMVQGAKSHKVHGKGAKNIRVNCTINKGGQLLREKKKRKINQRLMFFVVY